MTKIKTTLKIEKLGQEERWPFEETSEVEAQDYKLGLLTDLLYEIDRSLYHTITAFRFGDTDKRKESKEKILSIIDELFD